VRAPNDSENVLEDLHRRLQRIDLGDETRVEFQYRLRLFLVSAKSFPDHILIGVVETIIFDCALAEAPNHSSRLGQERWNTCFYVNQPSINFA